MFTSSTIAPYCPKRDVSSGLRTGPAAFHSSNLAKACGLPALGKKPLTRPSRIASSNPCAPLARPTDTTFGAWGQA